jgi:hypothetical protein
MSPRKPPENLNELLVLILDTQQGCQKMLIDMQAQLSTLTYTLVSLDSRAATLYSEQLEIEREKQRALLEKGLKDIALLRATVSKMVQ